jgi:hypothetical protein
MNIRNRVNSFILVDTSYSIMNNFNIQNKINLEIVVIENNNQQFKIYTDVSPQIRLTTIQSK